MKVLSIIGIVWFSFSLISVIYFSNSDTYAAAGWGMLGLLYAIPFSIICLMRSTKSPDSSAVNDFSTATIDLLKLNELKEKGILTEEEFQKKKEDLLKLS